MESPARPGSPAASEGTPSTVLRDSAQRQLEALRAAIDVRLTALDTVLADPTRGASLETLILDLARLATEEAQVAASRACVGMKLEADAEIDEIRKTTQATIDQERTAGADLRRALEQAQQRIAAIEWEKEAELRAVHEQLTAKLAHEHTAVSELERTVATLERKLAEAVQQVESERAAVARLNQAIERVEEASTTLGRDYSETRAAHDVLTVELTRERELRADLQRGQQDLQGQLEAAHTSSAALRRALEETEQRLSREANAEIDQLRKTTQATIDQERSVGEELRRALEQAQQKIATIEEEKEAGLRAVHEQFTAKLAYEGTAVNELERTVATLEQQLAEAERQVESERAAVAGLHQVVERAEAASTALGRDYAEARAAHDGLAAELTGEREHRADLQRAQQDLQRQLEAAHTSSAELRRALDEMEQRLLGEANAGEARTASHEELQRALDSTRAEVQTVSVDRDALRAEVEALRRDRDGSRAEVETLQREQEGTRTEVEALRAERDASQADLEAAQTERETSRTELVAMQAELQASRGDLEAVQAELQAARVNLEIARADVELSRIEIDELPAARAKAEEARRDLEARLELATRERDAAIQEREVALRERHSSGSTAMPAREPITPPREVVAAAPAAVDLATDEEWGPTPVATRYTFPDKIEIQVNGSSGLLCDLSVTGCQLLVPSALKPNQAVKLVLPAEPKPIACSGKVVWAQLELPAAGRPLSYRAGVQFAKADQSILEAFTAARRVLEMNGDRKLNR